jgi:hypothetical protein
MQVADKQEDYKTINHENIRYLGTINNNK